MFRLVKSELMQNAAWLTGGFIFLAISELAVFHPGRMGSCFAIGFLFGFLMLLWYFLRGAYYKSDALYLTLPINRFGFVSAKYITSAILFFGPPIYGLIFWDLLGFLLLGQRFAFHQMDNGFIVAHSVIARMVGFCIALGAILPLVLRWGSLSRISAMWILLTIVTSSSVYFFLRLSAANAARFGMDGWILIVALALLIIGLLSFRLSVWLVRLKEI